MSNYKVLFPMGSFYPAQTGGPDNTVYWITKALKRRGVQPIISSTDRGQPDTTPLNKWLDTDYGQAIYTRNPIHYLPHRVIGKVLARIKQVDVLHLTMITYPAAWITAILNSMFYGKPVVWSSRGDLDPPMLLRSRRKKQAVIWLIKKIVDLDQVLFHSTCDAETQYIRDIFGPDTNVAQIPNYMELPAKLDLPDAEYLLFVGRIDPKKGIENLLDALAQSELFMRSSYGLKVVGDHDNDYGKSLRKKVRELDIDQRVEFLGHQSGEAKEKLLAQAAFLVMPSHTENFGIVALEALAQGTPAIASTGTPWESLNAYEAGVWTDNDPESLRRAIETMLGLPQEELRRYGRNAFRLASQEFNIHHKFTEWDEAYRRAQTMV